MNAAIELEMFTAIGEGNTTSAMIAKRCRAVERGVRILCDFLTIHSFLSAQLPSFCLRRGCANVMRG